MIVKGWKGEDVVILCGCGHEPKEEHRMGSDPKGRGCRRCACEASPMMAASEAHLAVRVGRSLGILPPVGYVAPQCPVCGLTLDARGRRCPVGHAP